LLADVEPIEEGVRSFKPDAEPVGNFDFLGALAGLDLGIARNHLGASFPEAGHIQDTLDGGALAMGLKLMHQLVETHDAELRILEGLEVQQILELLFVLFLGFFLLR
jgi:hypothetical protein